MEAKEKAKELFNKFLKTDEKCTYSFVGDKVAKQCALIAVEEILNSIGGIFETYEERNYWEEVKQEIENMKLEIKHLAAYLPYGLEYQSQHIEGFRIHTMEGINIKHEKIYSNNEYGWIYLKAIKPILRPLSQLTQEITHNGEKFVPMIEIVKMIEPYYVEIDESTSDFNVINESTGKDRVYQLRYKNNYNNQGEISMLNFHENEKCLWHSDRIIHKKCYDKLYEWHFDIYGLLENNIYGLLENNLAIEKI